MIPGGSPIGSDTRLHGLLCRKSISLYLFREYCVTFVALLRIFNHAILGYPPNSSLVFHLFTVFLHITENFVIVCFLEMSSI